MDGKLHKLWQQARMLLGPLLNFVGAPGFVRRWFYRSVLSDAKITVWIDNVFAVINVNGLDIYFDRSTGRIDGGVRVGAQPCDAPPDHDV